MAILLLASTISWSVGKHYCMGRLMNVSLFEHAEDCGMEMNGMVENSISEESISCCSDELIVIEGQDNLKLSFEDIAFEKQEFLHWNTFFNFDLLIGYEEQMFLQKQHPPPLIIKDIQLLDEVFLI